MMLDRAAYVWLIAAAALLSCNAAAQQPFALDASFRAQFNEWYVSSILPLDDGDVIISGQIKFAGDQNFRSGARLNSDGTRDTNFPDVAFMGGKLARWQDKIYSQNGQIVRRHLLSGWLDPAFPLLNNDPYFASLQGGDYHVYPDGSLLISGAHSVNYPDSGWSGLHNLIWFTNTGRLDTTRTPRKGNGVISRTKELPPGSGPGQGGKFICTGSMTVYEGQATSNIFRVHADGQLDTSFYSGVVWGRAYAFLPLPDGRCYAGGLFRLNGIADTLRLVRFQPDGGLDPTFDHTLDFQIGVLDGIAGTVSSIHPLADGRLLVTGGFQAVNGVPHHGICIVDSAGQLDTQLQDQGCGWYVYQAPTFSYTHGSITGAYMLPDNMMYIWGAYHGYDDGVDSDPLQRFVTRLYGPDFGTGVEAMPGERGLLRAWPNPADDRLTVAIHTSLPGAELVLRDALGRNLRHDRPQGPEHAMTLQGMPTGVYLLELWAGGQRLAVQRVVVGLP